MNNRIVCVEEFVLGNLYKIHKIRKEDYGQIWLYKTVNQIDLYLENPLNFQLNVNDVFMYLETMFICWENYYIKILINNIICYMCLINEEEFEELT